VTASGAVLTAADVEKRCRHPKIFGKPLMEDWCTENLRGAKYDLRMSDTGMVLPGGRFVLPNDEPYQTPILLHPGQTIFVSTRERLHVPLDLVGNMSIKGDLSRDGILSLTGLIVDPGYENGPSADGRLHFRLANLGARPIVLKPGETRIASIQFLRLSGRAKADPQAFPNVWANIHELQEGLGFIEELGALRLASENLRRDFENQRRSVEYVVVAGVLVILATLFGVVLTGLLSLGADSRLVASAKNVVPDDRGGQWLFVFALFGLALIIGAAMVGIAQGRRPSPPDLDDVRRTNREAFRSLAVRRSRMLSLGAALSSVFIWGAVVAAVALGAPTGVDIVVGVCMALASIAGILKLCWRPITPRNVSAKLTEWYADEG
jgi:deoxycytidine triphosphate deaminase